MNNVVLIVEDESKVADLLVDYLIQSSYVTHVVQDGLQVMAKFKEISPDIVLLDVMLPGKDGMEICKEIRSFSNIPIIMITARVEEVDRLLGLELGADDYICKPFSPREVVARVKTILRRVGGNTNDAVMGLILDESQYVARIDSQQIELTAVEFKLLQLLASDPGRIYSRSKLMESIYDDHRIVSDRTIDSHIKKLRKKLTHINNGEDLIRSVYGVGYKLEL